MQSNCPKVIVDMIESGDLAELGGSAIKVYLVIKTSLDRSALKINDISRKAGISRLQVIRSIKKLIAYGYVTKESSGHGNAYALPTPAKPHKPKEIRLSKREKKCSPGFIYVASNPAYPGLLKIGQTKRQPELRLQELSDSAATPTSFELAFSARVSDIYLERDIHRALDDFRFNQNREFFTAPLALIVSTINQYIEAHNRL